MIEILLLSNCFCRIKMLHLIFLLVKLFLFFSTFLKLKGHPQLNLWKVSTLKHSKQQDSDSCGVFCFMVSIFDLRKKSLSAFYIWKPMLTFVNHSSQAPDEKVLRTYPPGLGKITIVYFYLSTGIMTLKMIFVLNEMCLFWKYHRCKHINEKKMKKGAGIIFLRRIIILQYILSMDHLYT